MVDHDDLLVVKSHGDGVSCSVCCDRDDDTLELPIEANPESDFSTKVINSVINLKLRFRKTYFRAF